MRKFLSILLVIVIVSALLVLPCFSAENNDFVFMYAWSNGYVNCSHLPFLVTGGYNNGENFGCYTTSVYDKVGYAFKCPVKLVTGDTFTVIGEICIPNEINLLELNVMNHYTTVVTQMGFSTVRFAQGGDDYIAKWYTFNFSFTESQSNPNDEVDIILTYQRINGSSPANFLGVKSLVYGVNNDPSVSLNQQANSINNNNNQNTDRILNGQQAQTNETYNYSQPSSANTSSGIASGGNLLDSLNTSIDSFNSSVGTNVDNLLNGISGFKTLVHDVFDIFPSLLQYLVIFGLTFIVIRKVVGR